MPDCNAQQRPHAMPGLGNAEGTKKRINERMRRDLINLPPPTGWEIGEQACESWPYCLLAFGELAFITLSLHPFSVNRLTVYLSPRVGVNYQMKN